LQNRATILLDVTFAVIQFAVLERLRWLACIFFLSTSSSTAAAATAATATGAATGAAATTAAGAGAAAAALVPPFHRLLSPWHNAMVGFFTGAITAAATEPIDVVRTRLMAQVRKPPPSSTLTSCEMIHIGTQMTFNFFFSFFFSLTNLNPN
jgi:hypothetical protein